ncbi:hypothetical protein JRQ81_009150 [Phrynocephalus forsythii]|uniref:Uncharacterized protein n=1 Tax=Phrynocephalus forsythii TaxID=171643 RepID=A0A9Q0XAA3_9SAUR|nr:hypothetical protein JRQ81_009150 [Phrynocephalus forsythii]
MGPCGATSFAIILFAFQAAGGTLTQNLTCNPGSSLALCLRPPAGGHPSTTHVLLWSASKRKGLALWVPEGQLYVVSPSHAGRFAPAGNSAFQLNNLKPGDQGGYEVLVRTPGGHSEALLKERTWYSFGINITTAPLAQDSCALSLDCDLPLPPFRTAATNGSSVALPALHALTFAPWPGVCVAKGHRLALAKATADAAGRRWIVSEDQGEPPRDSWRLTVSVQLAGEMKKDSERNNER